MKVPIHYIYSKHPGKTEANSKELLLTDKTFYLGKVCSGQIIRRSEQQ